MLSWRDLNALLPTGAACNGVHLSMMYYLRPQTELSKLRKANPTATFVNNEASDFNVMDVVAARSRGASESQSPTQPSRPFQSSIAQTRPSGATSNRNGAVHVEQERNNSEEMNDTENSSDLLLRRERSAFYSTCFCSSLL